MSAGLSSTGLARRRRDRRLAGVFLVATLAWTWAWWCGAILLGERFQSPQTLGLLAVGGLGPMVVALVLLHRRESPHRRADFYRRLFDPRPLLSRWGLVMIGLPLAAAAVGIVGYRWHAGAWPAMPGLEPYLAMPWNLIPFAIVIAIFGPIPGEIGWRGYALEHLQRGGVGAVAASLLLALVWMLWHVPLFLVEGSWHHEMGLLSVRGGLFFAMLIPHAFVLTWLYNRTRRSILVAVGYHFMVNFIGGLLLLPDMAENYRTAATFVLAIIFVLVVKKHATPHAPNTIRSEPQP